MLIPIEYDFDGVTMTGYLAEGSAGKCVPAVLIAHEAPGLDDQAKSRAEMLASLGYIAFAMDLYGEPFSIEQTHERHARVMNTPGLIASRASAALDALRRQRHVDGSRIAVIGFCQGGIVAMELARVGAPIVAAIGFHPGLSRPAGSTTGKITAKILMMIGSDDPVVPHEDRQAFIDEMKEAEADWQLHIFGGVGHTYTNPAVDLLAMPGFAYDARAERRAWSMMLDLLSEVFGSD